MEYQSILKTVRELFPFTYRDSQNMASKIKQSGVDPNSIAEVAEAGIGIYNRIFSHDEEFINRQVLSYSSKVENIPQHKGSQDYNTILKTINKLFPQSLSETRRLASKIYKSGRDITTPKDIIKVGAEIFHHSGEASIKELSNLIKSYDRTVKSTIQETSLKGHLKSYIISGLDGMDYVTFLNNIQNDVEKIVNKNDKPIKMRMTLSPKLSRGKGKELVFCYPHFNTKYNIITESTNFGEIYKTCKDKIIEDIETFNNKGSGWIFEKIINCRVHVDKYSPLSAKSYIRLPDKIRNKKAVVNIKNEDNQCFKWSTTRALFPENRDNERITKTLKANAASLNWDGLEFPVQVDKIGIFEKNNPKYVVNVYSYDKEVYPIRISGNKDREKTIDLLLISNDKTNHYCWIKSMSRLVNSQTGGNEHKRFYCGRCLNSFKTQQSLDKHSG